MKKRLSIIASLVVVISLILLARPVNSTIPLSDPVKEDIYQVFLEGKHLLEGTNPYERILSGDMRINDKYPTYFPLFYEASYLTQKWGFSNFEEWLLFWQKIFKLFDYLIALLLYGVLAARKTEWGGVIAAGFWLFNRWTLYIITTVNLDFIPIFFMLAALALFKRYKWLAMLLFSLSLALKQIGIFLAPLFMVWLFFEEKEPWIGLKRAVQGAAVIFSVPLIASLPFLFWNLKGFVYSTAFSVTRLADTHSNFQAHSIDDLLGWEGWMARIPMFLLFLAIYGLAARDARKRYLPPVLIFVVFISFNPVLYNQYLTWLVALVPLLLVDFEPGIHLRQSSA